MTYQLFEVEAIRATTQMAVLFGELMGYSVPTKQQTVPTVREWAAKRMMGCLKQSQFNVRSFLPKKRDRAREVIRLFNQRPRVTQDDAGSVEYDVGQYVAGVHSACRCMDIDVIASPLDGVTALTDGRAGSLSVLCGATPKTLAMDQFDDREEICKEYIMLVIGKRAHRIINAHKLFKNAGDGLRLVGKRDYTSVSQLLLGEGFLDQAVRMLAKQAYLPSVGTTFEGSPFAKEHLPLPPRCRNRRLDGSTIACGLGALLEKIDMALLVTHDARALQIAASARGLGGEVYAIPVHRLHGNQKPEARREAVSELDQGKVSESDEDPADNSYIDADESTPGDESKASDKIVIHQNARVRTTHDFLRDNKCIIVATSVTEICILDRTRYYDDGFQVESLVIDVANERTNEVVTRASWDCTFRDEHGNNSTARDEVKKLLNDAQIGLSSDPNHDMRPEIVVLPFDKLINMLKSDQ